MTPWTRRGEEASVHSKPIWLQPQHLTPQSSVIKLHFLLQTLILFSAHPSAKTSFIASAERCYEFMTHFKFLQSTVTPSGKNNFPSSSHTGRMKAMHHPLFWYEHCSPLDREVPWLQALWAHLKPPELHWASSSCSHMACCSAQNMMILTNHQWYSSNLILTAIF